jgi:hypothetical protein
MNVIRSKSDLDIWLDENNGFEDSYISDLDIIDETTIKIRIGYQIEGTYIAGTPRILKEYLIVAKGVTGLKDNVQINPNHCMEGISQIESPKGIGLELDVPEIIQFYCDELYIEEPTYIKSITKAWISDNHISAKILNMDIPKPIFWIKALEKSGFDVSWRYGGSDIKSTEQVPYSDYSGWFIQETNKIKNTQFGIFVSHISGGKNGFNIALERYEEDMKLWNEIIRIIAGLPNVEINIGNCTLTGPQWIHFISCGELPY